MARWLLLWIIMLGYTYSVHAQTVIPQVDSTASFAAWSPDGTWLLFTVPDEDQRDDLYRLDLATQQFYPLTTDPAREDFAGWSPDGEWLYFYRWYTPLNSHLYRIRPDGSEAQNLTPELESVFIEDWSPDGAWLILNVKNGSNGDLYRMHPDGSDLQQIVPSLDLVREYHVNLDQAQTPIPGYARLESWSLDGEWLIFSIYYPFYTDLFRVRPDGSQLERLTDGETSETFQGWSPDGAWLIYEQERDLYQLNMATLARELVTDGQNSAYIGWSPEGVWLLFTEESLDATGENILRQIYRTRLDGAAPETLVLPMNVVNVLDWSPDGTWLYLHVDENGTLPARLNWQTGAFERLSETPIEGYFAGFSGDGNWLLYPTGTGISLLAADGSRFLLLTPPENVENFISWTPDRRLFFSRSSADGTTFYRLNLADMQREPLLQGR